MKFVLHYFSACDPNDSILIQLKIGEAPIVPARDAAVLIFVQRAPCGGKTVTLMITRSAYPLILLSLLHSSLFNGAHSFKTAVHPLQKLTSKRARISLDLVPKQYPSLKMTPALKLVSTLLVALASATVYWNAGRQFETVDSIPSQYFKEKRTIEGEVVRVTDGDTIR